MHVAEEKDGIHQISFVFLQMKHHTHTHKGPNTIEELVQSMVGRKLKK